LASVFKAINQEFPDARRLQDRCRSSQGLGFGSLAEPAKLEEFPCESDETCEHTCLHHFIFLKRSMSFLYLEKLVI
jgi:hypothetical protein